MVGQLSYYVVSCYFTEALAMSIDIKSRYQKALDALVASLQEDLQVTAAILRGSMAYDEVWEKSDIDITIVVEEQSLSSSTLILVQDGIPIHAELVTRNELRRVVGRALGGSRIQSFLIGSKLLFSKDPTIEDIYRDVKHVGSRDRDLQVMVHGSYLVEILSKVEKWLTVKNDPLYASVFFTQAVQNLARIVTLLHGDVPLREAIDQAIKCEPKLLDRVYRTPLNAPKTIENIKVALQATKSFLTERSAIVFKAMIDYLTDEGDVRSTSEIEEYFRTRWSGEFDAVLVCDWLVKQGVLLETTADARITPKSRVVLSQPAYLAIGTELLH